MDATDRLPIAVTCAAYRRPRLGGAAAAQDAVLFGPGGDAELGWGAEQPASAAVDMLTRLGWRVHGCRPQARSDRRSPSAGGDVLLQDGVQRVRRDAEVGGDAGGGTGGPGAEGVA